MSDSSKINADSIRAARHRGFQAATRHMDKTRRERLENSYAKQDQKRETNVTRFYEKVRGGGAS